MLPLLAAGLLLAALFRRALRLRLSLLRHAALLAMSEWRCRISARANREHCTPITTERRKNQRFRLMKGVWSVSPTRSCVVLRARDRRERCTHRNERKPFDEICDMQEMPSWRDFPAYVLFAQNRALAMPQAPSVALDDAAIDVRACQSACEKNFRPHARKSASRVRFRHESSESVQVIRFCCRLTVADSRPSRARARDKIGRAHRPRNTAPAH